MILRTEVDDVLEMIEQFKTIDLKTLNELTGVRKENLELFLKCFAKKGLVKLYYPFIGNITAEIIEKEN